MNAALDKLIQEQDPTVNIPTTPSDITVTLTPPRSPVQFHNLNSVSESDEPISLTQEFEDLFNKTDESENEPPFSLTQEFKDVFDNFQ